MRGWAAALLLLAGCSQGTAPLREPEGAALEQAAMARGVVRDAAAAEPVGLYAREGDRLCVAGQRIGAFVDYGEANGCSARGRFVRAGERLTVDFGKGCAFEAGFDGDAVRFPGELPAGCEAACRGRASLSGLRFDRLSESGSEAAALRDPTGRGLCG
ncbi:hypothetical protein ASE67_00475 [Sphingomonas sp. Leaf23]|uniref:hypothetical protein n=1 Tax=Sphingomonas sp. Leaf23 TaxID=1735689 RepID=UPI0006F80F71|nr:hypothetical protein [Sphingomonas sp. Leaf23]KQM88277.1 hypothetical protein ASE67_00475 [Sphingomonas sp. Leaf23]